MEAFELSKLINSIDSILLQDVSTIKTISSTEMWPPIYICNLDKFVPLSAEHHMSCFADFGARTLGRGLCKTFLCEKCNITARLVIN